MNINEGNKYWVQDDRAPVMLNPVSASMSALRTFMNYSG